MDAPAAAIIDETRRKPLTLSRRVRFAFEAFWLKFAIFLLRLWPYRLARWYGGLYGWIGYLLVSRDRRVAYENLRTAFDDSLSPRAQRRIVAGTFMQLGRVMAGLFCTPRCSRAEIERLIDVRPLTRQLERLARERQGVVLATAHFNDWEAICLALGQAGYPLTMVTEPLPNPSVNAVFDACRGCTGNRLIPPKFAALKLFRALRDGQRVGLVCDVNGRRGRGGVWVDFFGRAVFNPTSMADLAIRTRSPIVLSLVRRQTAGGDAPPDGGPASRYVAEVFPPLWPDLEADRADEVRRLTQAVTDRIETAIRQSPADWLWTYKRWKRKPAADAPGYPPYAKFKRVI